MLLIVKAFTSSESPTGYDEQAEYEDEKHSAGTNGHESLEYEPSVEVDAIESADATARRVGEQFTMK